ncbi:MAG: glucose 1-dehydrogenase [Gemmatimonadales bacterium]|nr:MAG: glucose 1-dehydrogenase [Gemmatimonadales bacterium]
MAGRLAGKVAVVTGGNSGIGRAIARRFSTEGASVVIFGRNEKTLNAAADELGPSCLAIHGDVAENSDLQRLCDGASERFGGIDILVANAGVFEFGRLADMDRSSFDRTSDVNFSGVFFTVQAALPYLRAGGSVILVTSGSNRIGLADAPVYAATKAAVRSLARSLAVELQQVGVRVNALSPGFVDTPIFERNGIDGQEREQFVAQMSEGILMRRFGRPEEIAAAALFLASDDSSYITGIELPVSGGLGQV